MQYGTAHAQCQICKRIIQPHDLVTFQAGDLFHTRCLELRTQQGIEAERKVDAALHAWQQAKSPYVFRQQTPPPLTPHP
jgi:hypothetical protein